MTKTKRKGMALLLVIFIALGMTSATAQAAPVTVSDYTQLRQAIASVSDGDTITIDADIVLDAPLEIHRDLNITLQGAGGEKILTTASVFRHIYIAPNVTLTLTFEDVVLEGQDNGGGIANSGQSLTLINPDIRNGYNQAYGGAIHSPGKITLVGGQISGSRSTRGGAIYGGNITVDKTVFKGNTSDGHGGAIYCEAVGGSLNVDNAVFEQNVAAGNGGAMQVANSNLVVSNTQIHNNTAAYGGGLAFGDWPQDGNYSGSIVQSSFNNNIANGMPGGEPKGIGGAIIINSVNLPLYLEDVDITNNDANLDGGGIYTKVLENVITKGVNFVGNTASRNFDWQLDVQHKNHIFREASIVHNANISNTISTVPFPHIYNNYDVNFLPKYTVEFDSKGGSAVSSLTNVEHGALILQPTPDPTWNNHSFEGWFKEAGYTNKWDFDVDKVIDDIVLYAKWKDHTIYTLTVQNDGNGTASADGNDAKDIKTALAETEITLKATPNSGYQLKTWEVVSGGVTIQDNKFVMPSSNVTVKAIFEKIPSYAITVQTDGNGTAKANLSSAEAGTKITLNATPKKGYQFKNWKVISGDVTIKDDKFVMPASDVTVKAIFVKDSTPTSTVYSIKVQTDGNGTAKANLSSAAAGTGIMLKATPKSGYKFKNWEVISGDVTIKDNKFEMPGKDVTVKAIFEKTSSLPRTTPKASGIGTPNRNAPKTGDNSNIANYVLLAIVSLGGLATVIVRKKSRWTES